MARVVRQFKSGTWVGYYYLKPDPDKKGRYLKLPLGRDLDEAKMKWAELERRAIPRQVGLLSHIFDKYELVVIPRKSRRTQIDNKYELRELRKVFEQSHIDAIKPMHIARYREARTAKTRANRELALFSHIFNWAREQGFTSMTNPCAGVKRNKEKARTYYVKQDVWDAVYEAASPELKDALMLAYLTGQRPNDVRTFRWSQIEGDELVVTQGKTGNRVAVAIEGQLADVIDQIRQRPVKSLAFLISTPKGKALSQFMLRVRFDEARKAAQAATDNPELRSRIAEFQFRDTRARAASDIEAGHARELLGHSSEQVTRRYRRNPQAIKPTR